MALSELTITGKHGFLYQLVERQLNFGAATLRLAMLENPDLVIDAMFAHLERIGAAELLTEYCPYFGCLWPSAAVLARELAARSLAGVPLLELGCGLAVPGLVAAALGAEVTVTDAHPDVERFLSLNQKLNPSIPRLRFLPLDWRHPPRLDAYHIISGSDILYDKDHAGFIAELCFRHRKTLSEVIITDPGRPYAKDLIGAMTKRGFQAQVSTQAAQDGEREITVQVLSFVPGPK